MRVEIQTFVLLNVGLFFFENTVDPDQLASDEAILPGSTLFPTLLVNVCLQLDSCRLTG